jgi:hypothetical protein
MLTSPSRVVRRRFQLLGHRLELILRPPLVVLHLGRAQLELDILLGHHHIHLILHFHDQHPHRDHHEHRLAAWSRHLRGPLEPDERKVVGLGGRGQREHQGRYRRLGPLRRSGEWERRV